MEINETSMTVHKNRLKSTRIDGKLEISTANKSKSKEIDEKSRATFIVYVVLSSLATFICVGVFAAVSYIYIIFLGGVFCYLPPESESDTGNAKDNAQRYWAPRLYFENVSAASRVSSLY